MLVVGQVIVVWWIQGALPEFRKYPKVIIDKKEDKKKE